MEITAIRCDWSETAGTELFCPDDSWCSTLIHLLSPARCRLNDTWHALGAGSLLLLDCSTACCLSSSRALHYDMIRFHGDLRSELATFGLEPNHLYCARNSTEISSLISRLDMEFSAKDSHWQSCTQALLSELWITIYRLVSDRNKDEVAHTNSERLRAVRAEMMRCPERNWTSDMIAQQVNISVSSMYTLYRRLFSISPGQDIIRMRIEKGKRLLQHGHSVAEAAELLGYNNVYHFIRQFHRVAGVTPGKWCK